MLRKYSPDVIDRRIIWWLIFIIVLVPLVVPISIPVTVNPTTVKAYKYVESLPPGSVVIFSFGMSTGPWPELDPIARALFWHLMQKDAKVIMLGFGVPDSGALCEILTKEVESTGLTAGKKYGVDYVSVGFIPGGEITLSALVTNFQGVVKADVRKTPASELPLLANIRDYRDITFAVTFDGTGDYIQWVRQWVTATKKPFIDLPTQALSVEAYPYYTSGQIYSIVAGLRGGAEYETLIGRPGFGTRAIVMISVADIAFIGLMVIGNLFYFGEKLNKKIGMKRLK